MSKTVHVVLDDTMSYQLDILLNELRRRDPGQRITVADWVRTRIHNECTAHGLLDNTRATLQIRAEQNVKVLDQPALEEYSEEYLISAAKKVLMLAQMPDFDAASLPEPYVSAWECLQGYGKFDLTHMRKNENSLRTGENPNTKT